MLGDKREQMSSTEISRDDAPHSCNDYCRVPNAQQRKMSDFFLIESEIVAQRVKLSPKVTSRKAHWSRSSLTIS